MTSIGSSGPALAGRRRIDADRAVAGALVLAVTLGFIAVVYVVIAVGLGARFGDDGESSTVLSLAATVVALQDATRRRLEPDLHDGVQQQLVALKVKLGLGRAMANADGAPATAAALDQLAEEADGAVEAMRDFARGVHPPLLETEGLAAAVSAEARRLPIPVVVQADGIGRYGQEVEASVYYCINEALRNAVHSSPSSMPGLSSASGR
jgi:signal transduction histidine kinase